MDPIETLSVKKDSTLAMIAAAQQRGLDVFYLQQDGLVLNGGVVTA
ncbi:MAG TPA: glutathione synthase, partial [Gammaproteobacteria bacterium]|nr:glutathione synthase [Gammaproteobacteria bacterium]